MEDQWDTKSTLFVAPEAYQPFNGPRWQSDQRLCERQENPFSYSSLYRDIGSDPLCGSDPRPNWLISRPFIIHVAQAACPMILNSSVRGINRRK